MKKVLLSGIIVGIFLISIVTYGIASAQENGIPLWIKNTAGWWADDAVADSDFINSMQWLMENKILQVTTTEDDGWKTEADKLFRENQELEKQLDSSKKVVSSLNKKYNDLLTEKKFLTIDFKFSILQFDNWDRQMDYVGAQGVTVYSMIESSTFDDAPPSTISIMIKDMNGLSLKEFIDSDWKTYGGLLSLLGEVNFISVEPYNGLIDGEEAMVLEYTIDVEPNSLLGNSEFTLFVDEVVVGHRGEAYSISYVASTWESFVENRGKFVAMYSRLNFL